MRVRTVNCETAVLKDKTSSKLTDMVTLALYAVGITAGAAVGLLAVILSA